MLGRRMNERGEAEKEGEEEEEEEKDLLRLKYLRAWRDNGINWCDAAMRLRGREAGSIWREEGKSVWVDAAMTGDRQRKQDNLAWNSRIVNGEKNEVASVFFILFGFFSFLSSFCFGRYLLKHPWIWLAILILTNITRST